MDVTTALTLLGAPLTGSDDATDPANPEVAAAFTTVLAGLLTTPAPAVAPGQAAPDGEGAAGTPAATPSSPVAGWGPPAVRTALDAATDGAGAATDPTAVATASGLPGVPGDPAAAATAACSSAPDAVAAGGAAALEGDLRPGWSEVRPSTGARPLVPTQVDGRPAPVAAARHEPAPAPAPRPAPTTEPASTLITTASLTAGLGEDPDEPTLRAEPPAPVISDAAATTGRVDGTVLVAPAGVSTEPAGTSSLERVLAAQVVERVGRLVERGDGSHELSVELEPADLGRLELRVRLEAGVVHVHVDAHARGTSDLLRRALPELREALGELGLQAGTFDIGDHGTSRNPLGWGDRQHGRQHTDAGPAAPAAAARPIATTRPPVPTVRPGAERGVDVLL